jgi:hypothetical protein
MANLQIVISALNKASGDLNKVKKDIEGLGTAGKTADGGLKALGDGLSAVWSVGLSAAAAIAATAGAVKLLSDAAKEGAAFQRIEEASGSLAESMDADMDDILSSLQSASLGMVSDFDLMQSASRAMMLGVSADAGELSQLMEVAALRGRAMGLSTTQAFNDIVTGIGRASPLILDNLGIVVDAEARYKAYADSVGKTAEELSKAEKTQALLNGVLESSKGLLESAGGLTVDNAGKWEQLSAAQKNYFDMVKVDIADATSWWAEYWAAVFNDRADVKKSREVWEQARDMMLITGDMQAAYDAAVRGGQSDYTFFLDNAEMISMLEKQIKSATEGTDAFATSNYELAGGASAATLAISKQVAEQRDLADQMERMAKIQSELAGVTSLTKNFSGMISFAKSYDQALEDIVEQETIMANNPIGSEKYDEAKAKVDALKQSMADMANQVVLDMFMATIAVGGVTEAEANAYFNMAADMGLISRDAADAAIEAYGDAIAYINSLEIDPKTGNIIFEVDSSEADNYQPTPKRMLVKAALDAGEVLNWQPPNKTGKVTYLVNYLENTEGSNAVGGAVYGGNPYMWQEYGYRGEVLVPSADGFVLSRADAERALAKALYSGESAADPEAIGKAVAKALSGVTSGKNTGNVYNLTMPTSNNPADVRTAFELLEAWA